MDNPKAGGRERTFFNYFPTKEHVVAEHYGRQSRHAEDALRAIRGGESYRTAMSRARRQLWNEARSPAVTRSFLLALGSNQAVFDMALPHLEETRRMSNIELLLAPRNPQTAVAADRSDARGRPRASRRRKSAAPKKRRARAADTKPQR